MTKSAFGFTLIELMVVITIIGTLVVVLLPQLARFNNDQMLKNAASDLKSNIRKTQNNASSGLNCNEAGAAASKWTMSFTKGAASYSIAATCAGLNPGPSTSRTVPFPSGITISQIKIGIQQCSPASVIFSNISSSINFATTDSGCVIFSNANTMRIVLNDPNVGIGATATVTIGKSGAFY